MSNMQIAANLNDLELKKERTRDWLAEQTTVNEDDLESITETSSSEDDEDSDNDDSDDVSSMALGTQISADEVSGITHSLRDLMNSINNVQTVGNVNITNSTNVHIGNVTNINGNIQIIADNLNRQHSTRVRKHQRKTAQPNTAPTNSQTKDNPNDSEEERIGTDVFISRQKFKIPKELCFILPRHTWLAQMPMEEPQVLQRPVKYVVILHTATESSEKRAINVRLIRDIQCFHIESRGWNDIAYNFLIGCDGNIYEGRGWQTVGAHTLGYNKIAIGIAFIGCFMRELPLASALTLCKNLLARGVKEGHIAADYRLICHCQCSSTESPGRRLYEEIQTWPQFYNIEQEPDGEQ